MRASGEMSPQTFAKLSQHLASLDERDQSEPVDEGTPDPAIGPASSAAGAAPDVGDSGVGSWFEPRPAPERPASDPWSAHAPTAAATSTPAAGLGVAGPGGGAGTGVDTGGRRGGDENGFGYGGRGSGRGSSRRRRRRRRKYGASRKRLYKRRSRGRTVLIWALLGAGALVIAFVAVVATAYVHAYHVYGTLKDVPRYVTAARKDLQQGRLPQNDSLETANGLAHQAQDQISGGGFAFTFTKSLPLLGRPIKAISLAADAASSETDAAELVQGLIVKVLGPAGGQGDTGSPVIQNGVIDVGLLEQVTPTLQTVVRDLQQGDAAIRAIPSIPFFHQLDDLKSQVLTESTQAVSLSQRALVSFRLLPGFLGADRPKEYYLALQNTADQRGTGGAVLAYAIMKIDDGRISIDQPSGKPGAGPIADIDPRTPGFAVTVPQTTAWYLAATGVIHRLANGANYSPDFPSAARAWTSMLQSGKDPIIPRVDGVIALDPDAVAASFAGESFQLPEIGLTIPSAEIPKFVGHDQYELDKAEQRLVPGLLIKAAFDAITHPKHLFGLLQSMSTALTDKHIQMWSADPQIQAMVTHLGWDGALRNAAGGDYLALAYEKRLGNKLDYYTQFQTNYDVTVNASGGITSTYSLGLELPVPQDEPADIVGHFDPYAADLAMLNLYVPRDAHIVSYSPRAPFDPNAIQPTQEHVVPRGFVEHVERDLGGTFHVFTKTIMATPERPGSLQFRYTVPGVIRQTPEGKVYTLTVQHQPMVQDMLLRVRLRLPAGFEIVSLGTGWTATSWGAVYTGPVTSDFVTSVVFR